MAKKITGSVKLQIAAGKATPAPPVGPALGQAQINIMEFCKQFNEATKDMKGDIVPAEITIFEDRSFKFILKTPPAAALLKQAAGIEKGSGNPLTTKVGKVTRADVRKIAERKLADLNTDDLDAAERIKKLSERWVGNLARAT